MASRKATSGPGRGSPRTRTTARPGERSARPSSRRLSAETRARAASGASAAPTPEAARSSRGLGITRRFIALAVVGVVLLLSFASSLRVYIRQETQMGQARAQIAEHDARIAELSDEVERWKDPNYVAAQARQRLGWVMPGEVGYRVIGPDGKPLGGGTTVQGPSSLPAGEHPTTWWERLDGSLAAADAPLPGSPQAKAEAQRSTEPEITASAASSPTPSKSTKSR